jgi:hypothetical protein
MAMPRGWRHADCPSVANLYPVPHRKVAARHAGTIGAPWEASERRSLE